MADSIAPRHEGRTSPPPVAEKASALVKRKRNLPGMPDPEAEVIVLSPKTLLATNRFICEICNKGFQRDQNLQLHRRGHNLPWKLRQRTNKEIRKKVYVCPESTCVHHDPKRALGDLTGIKKHFSRKHGEKKWRCERCSKKYAVQSDWKAHVKTCGTREYRCDCGVLFSRRDSFITHRAFCDALAQETSKTQPSLHIIEPEDHSKTHTVAPTASSSSSLPPRPLTPPSACSLSPDLSIQSSEAPDQNQTDLPPPPPPPVLAMTSSPPPLQDGNAVSIFAAQFNPAGIVLEQAPPPSPPLPPPLPSTFEEMFCTVVGNNNLSSTTMESPVSLSLSPSFQFVNNGASSSLYATIPEQNRHSIQRYVQSPSTHHPAAMSATALLQKAAQIGPTVSTPSFLCGLGFSSRSPSENQIDLIDSHRNNNNKIIYSIPKTETDLLLPSGSTNLFTGTELTTLDLLGLGIGGSGDTNPGFSALITSMTGGTAPSFRTIDSGDHSHRRHHHHHRDHDQPWKGADQMKPYFQ